MTNHRKHSMGTMRRRRVGVRYIMLLGLLVVATLATVTGRTILHTAAVNHRYQKAAINIYSMLSGYIRATGGDFPKSEEALIAKGLLRKTSKDDNVNYEFRTKTSRESIWREGYLFDKFVVLYSTNLENVQFVDGQLQDRISGRRVLLIQGPEPTVLDTLYDRLSVRLFREACQLRQKTR